MSKLLLRFLSLDGNNKAVFLLRGLGAGVAQLVEQLFRKQQVAGPIPVPSSIFSNGWKIEEALFHSFPGRR